VFGGHRCNGMRGVADDGIVHDSHTTQSSHEEALVLSHELGRGVVPDSLVKSRSILAENHLPPLCSLVILVRKVRYFSTKLCVSKLYLCRHTEAATERSACVKDDRCANLTWKLMFARGSNEPKSISRPPRSRVCFQAVPTAPMSWPCKGDKERTSAAGGSGGLSFFPLSCNSSRTCTSLATAECRLHTSLQALCRSMHRDMLLLLSLLLS
jgi:hypothetical protein